MALPNQLKTICLMTRSRRLCQLAVLVKEEEQFSAQTQMMAAAITATEMNFRPLFYRLIEYTYVSLLILWRLDASSVSVGISQISIRHYVSLEGVTQFQSLRYSISAKKNLATCCKIIEAADGNSLGQICNSYNGAGTRFYRMELEKNYKFLCNLEAHRHEHKARAYSIF